MNWFLPRLLASILAMALGGAVGEHWGYGAALWLVVFGFAVQLWPADPRSALAQARAGINVDLRRAVYQRYGLPVKMGVSQP